MDSNKSKRVVVYCRVATQAQLDGDHTLEAQSARLHERAERLGYEIVGEVSEYEKGTTLDRDGWEKGLSEGGGAKGGHALCCRSYTDSARSDPLDAGFARVKRQGRLDSVRG